MKTTITGQQLHGLFQRGTNYEWAEWGITSPRTQAGYNAAATLLTREWLNKEPEPRHVKMRYVGRTVFNVWREAAKRVGLKVGFYEEQNTWQLNAFDAFAEDLTEQVNSHVAALIADYEGRYRELEERSGDPPTLDKDDIVSLLSRAIELAKENE